MPNIKKIELKRKCACQGYNLDKFIQPIILMILHEEPYSGYGIIQHMQDYSMFRLGTPDATGVYRHLRSMEERHHIELFEEPNEQGVMKKKYRITEEGRECLCSWKQTLLAYRIAVDDLITEMKDI
ncbi:MAG: PadR family transcriptional regulator [Lachnospiraceae bacterium]|nr:PadR family transcriptional regulator [Lachnospiraceae bacterium]